MKKGSNKVRKVQKREHGYINIAKTLSKLKDEPLRTVSHIYICQAVAFDLGLSGYRASRFSKECGYNFNITA